MLIRLPEGTWVKPEWVGSVEAHDGSDGYAGPIKPRAIVRGASDQLRAGFGETFCCLVYADTYDEAKRLRDEIASEINAALFAKS